MTRLERLLHEYEELPGFLGATLTSIHQRGDFGDAPIHVAVNRRSPEEVRILLDAGADPNVSGEAGDTPLHMAVMALEDDSQLLGNIIEQLLCAGASCDTANNDGETVWDLAKVLGVEASLRGIVKLVQNKE